MMTTLLLVAWLAVIVGSYRIAVLVLKRTGQL
jgi:hypothetical protein